MATYIEEIFILIFFKLLPQYISLLPNPPLMKRTSSEKLNVLEKNDYVI